MIIKKSVIGIIVMIFASIILTTGSPFQIANNLFENNGLLYIKYFGLQVYAADDDEDSEEYNKEADEQHDDED
jgi:cadmium resistance protein CadD (predicted permease)